VGQAAEEEAKAWIAKREEAVARFRSGGPQVLPRDPDVSATSWFERASSSWDAGASKLMPAEVDAKAKQ
jgi:hypothetical protein